MKFLNHEPLCDVKLFLIKTMKLLNHKILCDVNLKKNNKNYEDFKLWTILCCCGMGLRLRIKIKISWAYYNLPSYDLTQPQFRVDKLSITIFDVLQFELK